MTGGAAPRARLIRIVPGKPPELVVYDRTSNCPYHPSRPARLPLRLPARSLRARELDERLAEGDRRQGLVLYRTNCPLCDACIPLRLDVERFRLHRTHRRILRRGDQELTVSLGEPMLDAHRVQLYNKHKRERGLAEEGPGIDADGYRSFLVETCCDTFELRIFRGDELIGVSIVDRGFSSLSAVYTYYDPDHQSLSIGTYAILKQLELCRTWKMRYLYLGLYVVGARTMAYKAQFLPHQQRRNGAWVDVEVPE